MRNILRNEGPAKSIAIDLTSAALISLTLVLSLALLESLNNTITKQNAPGLIVLFGLLWLLPTACILIIVPVVRTMRAGQSVIANPINLLLSVVLLGLIAMIWGGILIDQVPCFMGVPNCD